VDYKYSFFTLALLVIVTGMIPFAISQVGVEPSMEIDMLAGQTQNPFRIQDNNDLDVFCIRPDGTICAGTYVSFKFQSNLAEVITVTDCQFNDYGWVNGTDVANEPCIFAQIDITQLTGVGESGGNEFFTSWKDTMMHGQIKRDAGAGGCAVEFHMQEQGDNFYSATSGNNISAITASFSPDVALQSGWDSQAEKESFRLIFDTGNDSTTCSYKSISLSVLMPDFNYLQYTVIKNGV
jgi:hypothetical protein